MCDDPVGSMGAHEFLVIVTSRKQIKTYCLLVSVAFSFLPFMFDGLIIRYQAEHLKGLVHIRGKNSENFLVGDLLWGLKFEATVRAG